MHLVRASALERRLMSRITNDMLLGAMVASTGLWVIGITVAVGYLVITAYGKRREGRKNAEGGIYGSRGKLR
jgi:hypothetical protein